MTRHYPTWPKLLSQKNVQFTIIWRHKRLLKEWEKWNSFGLPSNFMGNHQHSMYFGGGGFFFFQPCVRSSFADRLVKIWFSTGYFNCRFSLFVAFSFTVSTNKNHLFLGVGRQKPRRRLLARPPTDDGRSSPKTIWKWREHDSLGRAS